MQEDRGTLTGHVQNSGGTPLQDCVVQLYKDGVKRYVSEKTDANGVYRIDNVDTADYVVIIIGAAGAIRCANPSPYNPGVSGWNPDFVPGCVVGP